MCHVPDILQRLKVTIDIFCKPKGQWWFLHPVCDLNQLTLMHTVWIQLKMYVKLAIYGLYSHRNCYRHFFLNLTFESWCRGILWWFWYLICLNWMFCIWFYMIGGTKLRYSCALYLYKIFLPLNSSLIYSLMLAF